MRQMRAITPDASDAYGRAAYILGLGRDRPQALNNRALSASARLVASDGPWGGRTVARWPGHRTASETQGAAPHTRRQGDEQHLTPGSGGE
jgi:hypothetical protein